MQICSELPARATLRRRPSLRKLRLPRRLDRVGALLGIGLAGLLVAGNASGEAGRDRFDTVVLDAGHGGEDHGARSSGGVVEKELVLDVSRRLAERLSEAGLNVVMTRSDDNFVPLETRTSVANDARADLFLSIHANASELVGVRGIETFFASLDATDDAARALASAENAAFGERAMPASAADPLVAILGDLMATEHLVESQEFARMAQHAMAGSGGAPSRGVKQAPFVVLMGVQMPSALVEIGFLTNRDDEKGLEDSAKRQRIAEELASAVERYRARYDARRGLSDPAGAEE